MTFWINTWNKTEFKRWANGRNISNSRCAIPGYPNDTYAIQGKFHQQLINRTIPPYTGDKAEMDYDQCRIYSISNISTFDSFNRPDNNTKTKECQTWVYDKTVFESTFLSEVIIANRGCIKFLFLICIEPDDKDWFVSERTRSLFLQFAEMPQNV